MHLRLFPARLIRWAVMFAWIVAISVSAWVAAQLLVLASAPGNIGAGYPSTSDPVAAAQKIVSSAPMAVDAPAASVQTGASAYSLVGVATGFGRDRGFALLKSGTGSVIAVTEGEQFAPGVILRKIHADRVDIERAGTTESVGLDASAARGGTPPVTIVSRPTKP